MRKWTAFSLCVIAAAVFFAALSEITDEEEKEEI